MTKIEREVYEKVLKEALSSEEGKAMSEMYRSIATQALFEEDEETRMAAYITLASAKKITDDVYDKIKDHFEVADKEG